MTVKCKDCGSLLSGDEIALHRKLISRAAVQYSCLDCQADRFGVKRSQLEDLIAYYHRSGVCMLFAK